jgi:cell shape-determining protein MreD
LGVLGVLATMTQGALAAFLPPPWCPDLGLLVVVALGLYWQSVVGGFALATALGYVADLLSGTLLGQHALLRMMAYAAARVCGSHFNLRGPLPQMVFVAFLTLAHAVVLAGTTAFFVPQLGFKLPAVGALAAHALANALCAPLMTGLVGRLVSRLGSDDGGRRLLDLEPRSFRA